MSRRRPAPTPRKRPAPGERVLRADVAATNALEAAASVCDRCEATGSALIVVERGGEYRAECLARGRCDSRIRAELAGEA